MILLSSTIMGLIIRFDKFIITLVEISYDDNINAAYGTLSSESLPNCRSGKEFLARRRKAAPHPARSLPGNPETGGRSPGEAHRPLRQGTAADRRRPHRFRIRSSI